MPILGVIASSAKGAPGIPIIGTATDVGSGRTFVSGGRADVTFTAGAGAAATSFTIKAYTTSNVYTGLSATGASSPLSITGLTPATQYKYTVFATNAAGSSLESGYSNTVTATTIPQVPTITSATRSSNTAVSIAFTGATGGAALSAVTATSSPSVSITSSGTSSPMTATATYAQGTSYTFTITATNANGTSTASNTSSSVTPFPAPVLGAWSSAAGFPNGIAPFINPIRYSVGAASSNTVWVGTGFDVNSNIRGDGAFFNGTAWTERNYPVNAFAVSMMNFDVDTTMLASGGSTSGGNSPQSYYRTTNAWTVTTNAPVNQNSAAGARVSDGFIMAPGESGGTTSYSLNTVVSGTWTARATYPIGSGNRTGTHEGNGQTMYTIENNSSSSYKISSITGAFSASTTVPTGNANQAPQAFFKFIGNNNTMFYHANDGGGNLNNYLFNGTAYTASTAFPSGSTNSWAGGAIGNVISAVNLPTTSSTTHFRATLA